MELAALRRLPTRVFGIWMSLEPAVAALIGLAVLGQHLSAGQWAAVGCVVAACVGAARSAGPARRAPRASHVPRVPGQVHQTGAQATAASIRSAFVTESSLSQALIAPANPWATNCAMT